MSHYSNCCWPPVPPPHSLFQFLLGLLAAPSPLSPSTLPFCPAPNNSSLTSYQPTLLTAFHSFFLPKCICQMDKPLCIVWGTQHSWALSQSAPPNCFSSHHLDVLLPGQTPKPLSQPLLPLESLWFGRSPLPDGGCREIELVAHTKVEAVLGSCSFEIISHQQLQDCGFIYLLKHQCPLISQGPGYKLSTC